MTKQIDEILKKIALKNLSNVELIALVTETSYEVIFYAKYNNKIYQSNDLAEEGIISFDFVEQIYTEVAKVIRDDKKYDSSKMNIIKASENKVDIEYDDKKCRVYGLKKKWKEEIGL